MAIELEKNEIGFYFESRLFIVLCVLLTKQFLFNNYIFCRFLLLGLNDIIVGKIGETDSSII